jgi:predicted MFS family arabinose efflux permease
MTAPHELRLMQVFLPFAAAYFLSYVMRSVNAVLSGPLTEDLSLSASELGLLSSSYFLTFAAMQIPLGTLLDRHNPRNVESLLLVLAAIGCFLSAIADGFAMLWIGRALIGAGVAACLMASYKAFRLCFSAERQASIASLTLMVGSLGSLVATLPIEIMLPAIGWRGVFVLTGVLFLVSIAALMWLLPPLPKAPDHQPSDRPFWSETIAGVREVFAHPEVQRLIPYAIFTHGGFLAVQSLWIGPWFRTMHGMSGPEAATSLLIIGIAVMLAHLAMSWMGIRFARWGWSLDHVIVTGCLAMCTLGCAAVLELWSSPVLAWSLVFMSSAVTATGYAKVSLCFGVAMAGRATTAINFIAFVGAFIVQWGIGILIDLLLNFGLDDRSSMRGAFAVWLACQAFAVAWILILPRWKGADRTR